MWEELRKSLGQTIIVENRGGAGGLVGAEMLRQSAPDGYTLGLGTEATHVTSAIISKQIPYDPVAGFTPITIGSRSVMGIAVNTEVVPVTTLAGLIA
jgi:tripartite-type tricarboxylate transporter receptor subunit TctC